MNNSCNQEESKLFLIVITTIFSIIIVYYITVLAHEYMHATMAWLFGYKNNILQIYYGGPLLLHVDEAVNYNTIISGGHGLQAALIGIAGVSTNAILLIASFYLLTKKFILNNRFALIFFY